MAIAPKRTINDMISLDLNQQPLCTKNPDLEVNFELKSGLVHILPTFCGLACEDPHKHLKEFHVVCSGMRPQGITEEQIKLRAFPFSLADQTKDWLYFLPSGSITTWNDLKKQFLEKHFPASRAMTIRKEISEIRQFARESLFDYWGRFNELVKSCPHHQIPDHLLIQYFYEGLSSMDGKLIDTASGGALFNKTPTEARNLISIMASNIQQFGTRYNDHQGRVTSGKELQEHTDENSTKRGHAQTRKPEKEVEIPQDRDDKTKEDNPKVLVTRPPFPERFTKSKKDEEAKEILETFRKVEVNIHLLDVIKQIPR
ncbi:UNVERIFIED_CONTAM: hypothetical protein Sradi_0862600 [Sesamum radiatum]|uniref:Retrotransposon gag domain-containing protein n=1 Tax=Sesamum radiatum TaxID=300843 RepID=A0AAW2V271_SESRA